jgi:hypothetical protein
MPDFPPDFAGWADAGTGAPAAALPPDFAGWVPDAPRSTKSDEERRRQAEKIGLFDDDLLNHAQGLPTKGEDGPPQPEVVKSAQQELAARKKKFDDWEAPPTMVDSGIRGARQGATFNFGDELAAISAASPIPGKNPDVPDVSFGPDLIAGGARLLGEKIAPSIFGTGGGEAYDETKARERARNEEAQRVNPGSYLTGEFGGALATLPVTPMITPFRAAEGAGIAARGAAGAGNLATTGATYGAVAGAGGADGDLVDRAIGAGKGAALGAVVAPAVGGAVHSVGAAAGVVGDHIKASRNPTGVAQEMAAERVRASGVDPQELADSVQAAHDAGSTQFTLADASPDNLGGLPGTIVRQQGPGRAPAREFLDNRQFGSEDSSSQTQRVNSAISDLFGSGRQADEISAAADARSTQAQPHFDEAYKVGSYTTPVLDELATRPSVVQALNSAEKIANDEGRTLPTIIRDQNGNPVSNEAFQNFHADQRARIDRDVADLLGSDGSLETTNRLIKERADQSSPLYDAARSQTVPDNQGLIDLLPRLKAAGAFQSAVKKMRIDNQPFDIGNVRAWDYMKRALDDKIGAAVRAGEKDDARILTGLKRELTNTIDATVPEYGQARQVFSSHSDLVNAVEDGSKALSPSYTREQLAADFPELTSGEQEMFRVGASNALREKLANASGTGALPNAFATDGALAQKLQMLAPSAEHFNRFANRMADEARRFTEASVPDVSTWHYALKDINGKLARLVDKDTGEISSPAGKALRDIRDKITGELRKIPEYARGSDIEGTLDDTIAGAVKGRKAFTDERSRADVHAEIADMSPSAREAYVTAAGEALRNKISRSGDGTNAARLAYGNEAIREKIGEANAASGAPNAADLTRFDRRMADEKTMFATRNRAMLGTQTAERLADDASTARSVVEGLHAAHDLAHGNVISLITRIVRRVAEVNPQMRGRVLDEARKIVLNPDPKAVQGFVDLMKNAGVPEPGQQRIARSLHALTIQKSPADLSSQDDNKKPASWQLVRDKSKGGALVLFNPRTKETRPFKAAGAQ